MNTRMFTVASEIPMAAVLAQQFQNSHCAKCFQNLRETDDLLTCDDCLDVSYCSLKCQRGDWRMVHQRECEILQSQKEKLVMTSTMRLCLRVLLINTTRNSATSFNGGGFDELETNYNEFRSSPVHNEFISDIMAIVNTAGHSVFPDTLNKKTAVATICSVLCNAFSIIDEKRVEPIGTGIFIGLAKHNHSCSSTSHVVFNGNEAILRSPEKVYSESVTISYVSRMLPTSERRKAVRGIHFITCRCDMCLDEDRDLIGLAARCSDLRCSGFVKGSQCQSCGKCPSISQEEISQVTLNLLESLEKFYKSKSITDKDCKSNEFSELMKLRVDFGKLLADCNVAILQLDEQIAFCISTLPDESLPSNLNELAIKGYQHFITRLQLGSPEVTRRLYIACKCLERTSKLPNSEFIRQAYQSSCTSHGEDHVITKFFTKLLEKSN